MVAGLTAVIAAAVIGRATPADDATAALASSALASSAPVAASADEEAGPTARDGGRASIALGNRPARLAEREHGTDGLIGWFPFRALYAASAADADPAPPGHGDQIRRNGGLGWQTDPYAE